MKYRAARDVMGFFATLVFCGKPQSDIKFALYVRRHFISAGNFISEVSSCAVRHELFYNVGRALVSRVTWFTFCLGIWFTLFIKTDMDQVLCKSKRRSSVTTSINHSVLADHFAKGNSDGR